jgi:hypothetical protein
MKSSFFIALFLCIITYSKAQTKVEIFEFFNDMKGSRLIVVDTAILHVGPSSGAAQTDTLFFGENINVLMPVPYFEQVNDIDVPWLKITYFKKGFTKVSYVLAHQVSLTKPIEEDKNKWLVAIKPNEISKEKSVHILCSKENKINNNIIVQIPNTFTVDSIQFSIAEKPCLQNSNAMFLLQLKSNKVEEGEYKKWIVICENQIPIQLPFVHSFFSLKFNATVDENISFINQNTFKILNQVLLKKTKTTQIKYRWQNCSYMNN